MPISNERKMLSSNEALKELNIAYKECDWIRLDTLASIIITIEKQCTAKTVFLQKRLVAQGTC